MKTLFLLMILMTPVISLASSYWDSDCSSFVADSNMIDGRIDSNLSRCVVSINKPLTIRSHGGDVTDAIRIALAVKSYGVTVRIKDYCSSACFLIASSSPNVEICRGAYIGLHKATSEQGTKIYLEYLDWVSPYSETIREIVMDTPNGMMRKYHRVYHIINARTVDC